MFDLKDFNVGDRVILKKSVDCPATAIAVYADRAGTITSKGSGGVIVRMDIDSNSIPLGIETPIYQFQKLTGSRKDTEFKVGDRVVCDGKRGVILADDGSNIPYLVKFDETPQTFWVTGATISRDKGEVTERKKIIIFTVGNEVFAKLIYSDKSFTVASAKCNPADTFDILVGAQIALQRLTKKLNSKLVLPTEALQAVQVEVKINDTQNFEVV